MLTSAHIARRLRAAAVGLVAVAAFGTAPSAQAGSSDDLLRAVVPGAVADVAAPVTAAVGPAADPIATAAAPVTDPVVEAAAPVKATVDQAVAPVAETVAAPVRSATEPTLERVVEHTVAPTARRAAPLAKQAAREVVSPVAERVAPAARQAAHDVVSPVAERVAPVARAAFAAVETVAGRDPGDPRRSPARPVDATGDLGDAVRTRLPGQPSAPSVTPPLAPSTGTGQPTPVPPATVRGQVDSGATLSLRVSGDQGPDTNASPLTGGAAPRPAIRPTEPARSAAPARPAAGGVTDAPAQDPSSLPSHQPSATSGSSVASGASNPLPAALAVLPDLVAVPRPGPTSASSTPIAELSPVHLARGLKRPG